MAYRICLHIAAPISLSATELFSWRGVLCRIKCLRPGVRLSILPPAVTLKRLANDFLVFCMILVNNLVSCDM